MRWGWLIVGWLALGGCAESVEQPPPARTCEVGETPPLRFPAIPGPEVPGLSSHGCRAYVGRDGTLFVAGMHYVADGTPGSRERTSLSRLVDRRWEPVAPPIDGPVSVPVGIASTHRALYVLLLGGAMFRVADETWTELAAPGEGVELMALEDGPRGWPVAVGRRDETAQLYELNGGRWEPLGEPLPEVPPPTSRPLGVACDGRVVVLGGLSAFELRADGTWRHLGVFGSDEVDHPGIAVGPDAVYVAWSRGLDLQEILVARHRDADAGFVLVDSPLPTRRARWVVPWVSNRGEVFIAWREDHISTARLEGDVWAISPVGAVSGGGTLPHLTGGSDGLPVVCWEAYSESGLFEVSRAVP